MKSILLMFSIAPCYEWDWERFNIEYMVFDGLYKMAEKIYGIKASSHKKRFKLCCDKFNIIYNEVNIKKICEIRNDLFHETFWDKGMPYTD